MAGWRRHSTTPLDDEAAGGERLGRRIWLTVGTVIAVAVLAALVLVRPMVTSADSHRAAPRAARTSPRRNAAGAHHSTTRRHGNAAQLCSTVLRRHNQSRVKSPLER